MFIAVVGTRFAGKSCVEEFLVSCKGFTLLRLSGQASQDTEVWHWFSPSKPECACEQRR